MKSAKNYIILFLLSISLIALELVWTRLFSAEYFYTYAFLILSLAIMGLGLGALTVRLFSFLNRPVMLGISLSLTALAALGGPPLVFDLGLQFSQVLTSSAMMLKLAMAIILLGSAFFFGGISIALIFKNNHENMPRLYMADLIGAGLGVFIALIIMNAAGTPKAVFYLSIPVIIAAFLACRTWLKIIPVALLVFMMFLAPRADSVVTIEREERAPVIYTHWDAMAKIKIFEFQPDVYWGLNIDNMANSPVLAFDGNWDKPDSLLYQFGIPVEYLINRFDSCTFLSLGAGGGQDVLQALQEGATEIHAVEVVPHINQLMTDGMAADFSGHIYDDPRVIVATEDARTYVRNFKNKFDVIYSLSSNSFAALSSGSFAMAENYLFTSGAFKDYWTALSDSGFLSMEHQFFVPRMAGELMEALTELGVENPTDHFAIYNLPSMRRNLILLSKQPLTDEIRNNAYVPLSPETYEYIHLLYPAPDSTADNLVNRVVTAGWQTAQQDSPVALSPCSDDRPFTAQLGLWRNMNLNPERLLPFDYMGYPLSKMIIVAIILIVIVLAIPLNLLPYFKSGEKLKIVPWLYFFTIGMAFMLVEVILIQKYTFFVGPQSYSVATILFTLLLASGIGSRFSKKVPAKIAFMMIVGWILLDALVFKYIIYGITGWSMAPRIILTMLLIAPLGFFMGMPFPKAALRVGELIDWGFAVNGAASVIGASAIMLVAFEYGFTVCLIIGAVMYLLAYGLYSAKAAWK